MSRSREGYTSRHAFEDSSATSMRSASVHDKSLRDTSFSLPIMCHQLLNRDGPDSRCAVLCYASLFAGDYTWSHSYVKGHSGVMCTSCNSSHPR